MTPDIYVDKGAAPGGMGTSWADAFDNLDNGLIQAGLNGVNNREIWVAEGTYVPSTGSGRQMTFTLPNGTQIYGGFDGTELSFSARAGLYRQTVLAGDIGMATFTDNSYHVVTVSSGSDPVRIDGFQIENGNANGSSLTSEDRGGGIFCVNTDLELRNLFVENNLADFGGGVYFEGGSTDDGFRMFNGWFTNNVGRRTGGAVHLENLGVPSLSRLATEDEPSWIYNSTFYRNRAGASGSGTTATDGGGAIYVAGRRDVVNTSYFGSNVTLAVYNGQFFDNYVYGGGAAVRIAAAGSGGRTLWYNCTMAYNVVLANAGGSNSGTLWMASESSGLESAMSNSIVYFTLDGSGGSAAGNAIEGPGSNSGNGSPSTAGTFWAVYSDIFALTTGSNGGVYGNGSGVGVIDVNPNFVDPTNFDLALDDAVPSLCIDAGTNAQVLPDLPDMDGDTDHDEDCPFHVYAGTARVVNSIPDMGCFEDQ